MIFDLLSQLISIAIAITISVMIVSSVAYYLRFKISSLRQTKRLNSASTQAPQQSSPAGVA